MTAEGMKCPACSTKMMEMDSDLTSAAGSMPGKLLAVVILMSISILLNVISMSLVSAIFGGALLAGLFVGNDGVRRFVVGLMWVNLMIKIGLFIFALGLSGGHLDGTVVALSGLSMAISGFVVWALVQNDVRDWMFKTAFKDGLDSTSL